MPLYNPPSTSGSGLTGFRNRLINGDMRIDQRRSGAAQTFTAAAALAYSVDQWYGYCTGANVTGQQVAGASNDQYRYQFTGAASVTAIGFGQRIEALNTYDLNNQTVTLSVGLSNSLLTSVGWEVFRATTTADTFGSLASPTVTSIASGTFTVNSTFSTYSAQISLPSAAITGLEIRFTVGAQTSGTWVIGNAQLELGSSATTFERRPYNFELAECSRYCPAFVASAANHVMPQTNSAASTTAISGPVTFSVPTRVAVTGIVVSTVANIRLSRPSTGLLTPSAVSFQSASLYGAGVQWTVTGAVTDQIYYLSTGGAVTIYFTGAEL